MCPVVLRRACERLAFGSNWGAQEFSKCRMERRWGRKELVGNGNYSSVNKELPSKGINKMQAAILWEQ
jgi:hypothetical protein